MTTLNSDWQLIAQSDGFSWYYGTQYARLYARATENITDNTSTIQTQARIYVTNGSIDVSNWHTGLDIDGADGGYTTFSAGETTLLTDTWIGGHNADGTGSVSIGMNYSAPYGVTSWSWRGTVGLNTIPRTSNISLSTSGIALNGSSSVAIYTNRASSSFTHTIQQNFNSTSFTNIATGVGSSYTWVPPTSWYSVIGNGSKAFTIRLITYSGSTQIGYTDASFTVSSARIS